MFYYKCALRVSTGMLTKLFLQGGQLRNLNKKSDYSYLNFQYFSKQ